MNNKRNKLISVLLIVLLVALVIVSLCSGKYEISPLDSIKAILGNNDIDKMTTNVVLGLRLPRIIAAIIVGAALSVSGAAYQGLFKNPLISSDFLGVSSGAAIGAAISILLSLSNIYISLFAFIGGIIAVFVTTLIPTLLKNRSNITLVLSGIIVSSFMSSILGFIKFVADPNSQLASITYWTMGSFSYVSLSNIVPVLVIVIPCLIVLILISWWIDVMSMGESEAKLLGANVTLIKTIIIITSTLLTSSSVCLVGTIGWVSLIIPHLTRLIFGHTNKVVIPNSILLGSIFMLVVDTLTRLIGPIEMPVSIMTGIIGVPFFIWLLVKRKDSIL